MLEFGHHQLLKFFHSYHMHSLRKHLESITSITLICGMTYSKHLFLSLCCHLDFCFTYLSPPEKKKSSSIATEKRKEDRSWFKEANDSNCAVVYCIMIGWFLYFWVSFISVSSVEKKLQLTTDLHFSLSEKSKIIKLIILCSEKNENRT